MKYFLIVALFLMISCNPKVSMNKVVCKDGVGNIILSGDFNYASFEDGVLVALKNGEGGVRVNGTCTIKQYYKRN